MKWEIEGLPPPKGTSCFQPKWKSTFGFKFFSWLSSPRSLLIICTLDKFHVELHLGQETKNGKST